MSDVRKETGISGGDSRYLKEDLKPTTESKDLAGATISP